MIVAVPPNRLYMKCAGTAVICTILATRHEDEGSERNAGCIAPILIFFVLSYYLKWVRHVARMGERKSAYRILVGRPEERRPVG
jgi:hypothetical protein